MESKLESNTLNKNMDKFKSFFKSLSVNGRDIISTLIWIVAVLFVAQVIAVVGDKLGVDLSDIKDFVFAIGKFATAALLGVGYLTHITFRQSLGEHDSKDFMTSWHEDFSRKEKTEWFLKICLVGLSVAGVVLAIGV